MKRIMDSGRSSCAGNADAPSESLVSTNPKNVAAAARVKIGYLPPAGIIHGAHACMDGAGRYGPYNWRETKIALMEYISAAQRHLIRFQEGEPLDPKSMCHHLGHVIATCAIMLDAIELGFYIDDRPGRGRGHELLDQIRSDIEKRLSENV